MQNLMKCTLLCLVYLYGSTVFAAGDFSMRLNQNSCAVADVQLMASDSGDAILSVASELGKEQNSRAVQDHANGVLELGRLGFDQQLAYVVRTREILLRSNLSEIPAVDSGILLIAQRGRSLLQAAESQQMLSKPVEDALLFFVFDYVVGTRSPQAAETLAQAYEAYVKQSWEETRTDVGRYALPRFGPRAEKYHYLRQFDSPPPKKH